MPSLVDALPRRPTTSSCTRRTRCARRPRSRSGSTRRPRRSSRCARRSSRRTGARPVARGAVFPNTFTHARLPSGWRRGYSWGGSQPVTNCVPPSISALPAAQRVHLQVRRDGHQRARDRRGQGAAGVARGRDERAQGDPLVKLSEVRGLFHNETSATHRDGGSLWSFYRLRR